MSRDNKKLAMELENISLMSPFENACVQELEDAQKLASVDEIPAFFENSTVFMTGVTGFLGHVLLAKLLSSCPGVQKIYVLIREKRNRNVDERLQDLLNGQVFEKARTQYANLSAKIKAVKGDCLKANLGMSEVDRQILQNEVNVVFHVAATVKFDAPLKEAVNINVRSTRDLLEIAKQMKHLQAFLHVSTAFSFCTDRRVIEEKLYEAPMPASSLIKIMDILDDEIVEKITPGLLNSCPNTYVFTKAVAEGLFSSKTLNLPATIFRPAIVVSTAVEPIPGWINNTYGPTGIVAAAGLGLLRTLHADKNCVANIVPCDYVINAMIASAWFTAKRHQLSKTCISKLGDLGSDDVPIFNFSSSELKDAITWEHFMYEHELLEAQIPFSGAFWKYVFFLNKYKFVHQIFVVFLHLLPAFFVDGLATIRGMKPELLNAYRKIHKLCNVISFFSTREWRIPDDHVQHLWTILSDSDRQKFYFNLNSMDWKAYFRCHLSGIREYVIKDKLDTVPYAAKRRKILTILHYGVLFIVLSIGILFIQAVHSLFS